MTRNLITLCAFAACAALFAGSAAAETLKFDIFRNGKPFGTHIITLVRQGDSVSVNSKVQMEARVGPVVAFKYRSICNETWKSQELETLSCTTLKGGATKRVDVKRAGEKLAVSVDGAKPQIAPDLVPVSPWNMFAIKEQQTIGTDDGKIWPLAVTDLGAEKVNVAGQNRDARRIRYKSNLTVDSWYDSSGRWLKAQFQARGQKIEYRAKPEA
jgi:hypothetical protein